MPYERSVEGIQAAEQSILASRNPEGTVCENVDRFDPRHINYYDSRGPHKSLTGHEGLQPAYPSFEPITNINLPTGSFAGHTSRDNIGRTMQLIRIEGTSQGATKPTRAKARKSKSSMSRTHSAAFVARNRLARGERSQSAEMEPRNRKSKKRVASTGGRQYRKSIDRIVNSPTKNMLVRDMLSLTPKYPRQHQQGITKVARSLSAKSLLLPKRRVLVSPFRKNTRKEIFSGALPNKRARSAFGQTAES
jgi:hypothetical protein